MINMLTRINKSKYYKIFLVNTKKIQVGEAVRSLIYVKIKSNKKLHL